MSKYRIHVQTTNTYEIEAESDLAAKRTVMEHYSNDTMSELTLVEDEVYFFADGTAEELSVPPTSV